ncbi:MAG: 50S ribosomal protein L17 [Chloroflexaceae bacterium]|nr:50S ribosomal protein L17 [Chloroflexaceae bacterium]
MRHRRGGAKLGRSAEHRKALLRNLMIALIEHRRIRTTLAKGKAVQPEIERLLRIASTDTPHARRMVLSKLDNKNAMRRVFTFVPEEYGSRPGGYTRLIRLGPRQGDAAEMVMLELV